MLLCCDGQEDEDEKPGAESTKSERGDDDNDGSDDEDPIEFKEMDEEDTIVFEEESVVSEHCPPQHWPVACLPVFVSLLMVFFISSFKTNASDGKRMLAAANKIDVYAFALLAWALMRWRTPFLGLTTMQILSEVGGNNLRPDTDQVSELWGAQMTAILTQGWDANPRSRPSMARICARLNKLDLQLLRRVSSIKRLPSKKKAITTVTSPVGGGAGAPPTDLSQVSHTRPACLGVEEQSSFMYLDRRSGYLVLHDRWLSTPMMATPASQQTGRLIL